MLYGVFVSTSLNMDLYIVLYTKSFKTIFKNFCIGPSQVKRIQLLLPVDVCIIACVYNYVSGCWFSGLRRLAFCHVVAFYMVLVLIIVEGLHPRHLVKSCQINNHTIPPYLKSNLFTCRNHVS